MPLLGLCPAMANALGSLQELLDSVHEGKAGSIKERLAAAPAWETQSPLCSLEGNADM